MQFRKDINGLRAIAVIAVVLFHFNPSWLPGGFAGVDVFFVISGFLMTGIIFKGLENNNFSILKFYIARANRIIPALAVLCLTLLIFGWFYLTPLDYKTLGLHVESSVGFYSNFTYWKESGYFDSSSHEKWLLHTWSLSAEWQFYMVYPIMLVLLKKFCNLKTLKLLLSVGTFLAFAFCVVATYKWPNSAYYLLPTRAWEMMVGALAFLYPITLNKKSKFLFESMGVFFIAASYFLISNEDPWPGYLAIFPVVGSFLILQAHRNNSLLTSNIVFQKLGTWSYSIYLWHWPIVVAIYYYGFSDAWNYFGIGLSVLLGFLSYNYVERFKFSCNEDHFKAVYLCKPLYMAIALAILGKCVFINGGFISHYSESVQIAIFGAEDKNVRRYECLAGYGEESRECEYGEGPLDVIVLGDSHAQSLLPVVTKVVSNKVLDWTLASCRTIQGVFYIKKNVKYTSCRSWLTKAIKKMPSGTPIIIHNMLNGVFDNDKPNEYIESSYIEYMDNNDIDEYRNIMSRAYVDTICTISESNPVILIKDTPYFESSVPLVMAKKRMIEDENYRVSISIDEYRKQNKHTDKVYREVENTCKQVTVIDPADFLCDSSFCYGDDKGRPLYFDSNHLNEQGAKLFETSIRNSLTHLLN